MKFTLLLLASVALGLPTVSNSDYLSSVNTVWDIVDKHSTFGDLETRDLADLDSAIKHRYLVTFRPDATQQEISQHFENVDKWIGSKAQKRDGEFTQKIEGAFSSVSRSSHPSDAFAATGTSPFDGYYGKFDNHILDQVRKSSIVDTVEPDTIQTSPSFDGHSASLDDEEEDEDAAAAQNSFAVITLNKQLTKSWGLDRISHVENGIPADVGANYSLIPQMEYIYAPSKHETVAYVLDTGVNTTNAFFGGRASEPVMFTEGEPHGDYAGHGTHVAGILGSANFGVAKDAKIVSVKVLNMGSAGPASAVINGVNWVIQNNNATRAVINYSAAGPVSKAMNQAFAKAVEAGITVVVSAGNFMKDACDYSPANIGSVIDGAIVVAASDQRDKFAVGASWGSNYGPCVSVFAPGTDIPSLHWKNERLVFFDSGTSMSAPFVSGMVLYHQSQSDQPLSPKDVADKITNSNQAKIISPMQDTANGLVYNEAIGKAPVPVSSENYGPVAPTGQPLS
ncbi:Alkaline extracellular protease [Yarrowia sp. C11]|nr:Alkaline extracellular protease [Yarrowia sp. E02]KAG5365374.1 Alkaline extracellular protease [Yarrowia sp. C11]